MKFIRIAPVVLMVALLSACQSGPKETGGTLLGAGLGALAGSQIGSGKGKLAAVAIGAVAGAMIGGNIGRTLDAADRRYAMQAQTQAHASPLGQQVNWNNPQSGNYGSFTPTRDGRDANTGAYCREYQTVINVGGRQETAYGTACKQPDGSWKISN